MLRLTLKEKLDTIRKLDAEIVDLIDDKIKIAEEIEQADGYKETLMLKADELLSDTPTAPPTPAPATPLTTTATPAPLLRPIQ